MKNYQEPEVDVVRLDGCDIICTSGEQCMDPLANTTKEVELG